MSGGDGGLGTTLVGEKITIGQLNVTVTNLIGEGKLKSDDMTGRGLFVSYKEISRVYLTIRKICVDTKNDNDTQLHCK